MKSAGLHQRCGFEMADTVSRHRHGCPCRAGTFIMISDQGWVFCQDGSQEVCRKPFPDPSKSVMKPLFKYKVTHATLESVLPS